MAWKHAQPTRVHRESAEPFLSDRGTGQGDVDAPMEASMVQGSVARGARRETYAQVCAAEEARCASSEIASCLTEWERQVRDWECRDDSMDTADESPQMRWQHPANRIARDGHLMDVWYLDDGTIVAHPLLGVAFLEAFDRQSQRPGSERNRTKTKAAFLLPAKVDIAPEWRVDRLKELADVTIGPSQLEALGAETVSGEAVVRQFKDKTRIVDTMVRRIALCQDAQVELTLQRSCLGISKVNHLLRVSGTELAREENALLAYDNAQLHGLRRLVPGLTDNGAEQAMRAAGLGGVGLLRAQRHAAAANLASLVLARPKVADLADACGLAGLLPAGDLVSELDRQIRAATDMVREQLRDEERASLDKLLCEASRRADEDWKSLCSGRRGTQDLAPRARRGADDATQEAELSIAQRSVLEGGHLRSEPDELGREPNAKSLSAAHLQREIGLLVELVALDAFLERIEIEDDRASRRLAELLDKATCHDWLWKLNPRDGSRLAEEDFLLALASRLGAELVDGGEVLCQQCGEVLDASVGHAICCSKAESTKGHYAVVGAVADGMCLADPSLQTEVRGLANTSDRPADILTTAALPGVRTALDITIASQDAVHAGIDACATAYRKKMTRYATILPALRRAGVIFQPMVWSAEGRPHPATVRVLECALRTIRARKGLEAAAHLRTRWRHEISVAIQRRKAAMIRAALPARSRRQEWLASGQQDTTGNGCQLPPLDPDGEEEEGDKEAEEAESPQADEAAMEP